MAAMVIDLVLEALDRGYNKKSWHGPNLRGTLRGVEVAVAAWRPDTQRHNIWEHALHAAYWKYIAHRRLRNLKHGSFPLKGSNWFARPADEGPAAWKDELELLEQTHRELRAAVECLRPQDLDARPPASKVTSRELLLGVAAHDVYHAGQIQLLKRLWQDRASTAS